MELRYEGCFVQFAPVLGDVESTIRKIDSLTSLNAAVDVWVLPELCNSGYNFGSREQTWDTSEEVADSVFIQYLESMCAQYSFYIVSGFNERDSGDLYNSAVLVGPGGYIGKYRKLHLFMNEKDYFLPGNVGLPVFDIGLCRLGMLVCFDWIFPESARSLSILGADIICHPANLVLPFCQDAMVTRCLENGLFAITANRIGSESRGDKTMNFTGMSQITANNGKVLARASKDKEEVNVVEFDPLAARSKSITQNNELLSDRRPSLYIF